MGLFNPGNENWQQYIEILDWYFLAVDKNKDKLFFVTVAVKSLFSGRLSYTPRETPQQSFRAAPPADGNGSWWGQEEFGMWQNGNARFGNDVG